MSPNKPQIMLAETVTRQIARCLAGLRFGSVELTIHDGRIVQIERREKLRLDPISAPPAAATTPFDR